MFWRGDSRPGRYQPYGDAIIYIYICFGNLGFSRFFWEENLGFSLKLDW